MSGRSAYVRKKINDPKSKGPALRGRANSVGSERSSRIGDGYSGPDSGTGYGTTNARFLKFSDNRDADLGYGRHDLANFGNSSASISGGTSDSGRAESVPRHQGPMPDYAYARVRKPVLKTEDVSGIERSGFRSAIDKRSEDVRKGLTKAFSFGNKKKKGGADDDLDIRSPSSAAARSDYYELDSPPPPMPDYHMSPVAPWETDYRQPVPMHQAHQHAQPQQHHQQQYHQQPQHIPVASPPLPSSPLPPASIPPPTSKLPPIPPTPSSSPIKRWIGSGRPVQRWNKLRKDPELWDPNGDVLVYLGHKGQVPRPNPSFRLSSHIIEATESRYLVTLLREGSTEDDDMHNYLPPSPVGAPPMVHPPRGGNGNGGRHHLGPGGQPTPPISDSDACSGMDTADGQISYELYFPTPSNMSKMDAHRHAITTRNVFALLYHASLVGLSLFQALTDLHTRLDAYMPPESDLVGTLLNYLTARNIDDCRDDAETAVSLLAWSETPEVRWEEGWREAFLHCAGMYGAGAGGAGQQRLESCADWKQLTPITRALLERACLETQLRVQAAEERLAGFEFVDEIWPVSGGSVAMSINQTSPSRAAAERLQKFFVGHYNQMYGAWPPSSQSHRQQRDQGHGGDDMWLTRTLAQQMQREFGALYDYLVNREVVWDESETRSGRKWMMVSTSGSQLDFDPDTPDLPLTDLLIEYDNRMRFPHIPYPYPLVPESISPIHPPPGGNGGAQSRRDKYFGGNSAPKQSGNGGASADDRLFERRVQFAYTEATNIYILGSDFTQTDLIDAFVRFEKADHVGAVDPFVARRGRWLVVYGILQTLASVSVDAPDARYKGGIEDAGSFGPGSAGGVSYHLSPRLRGTKTPPWKGASTTTYPEAAHELSHCWLVPRTWQAVGSAAHGKNPADDAGDDGNLGSRQPSNNGEGSGYPVPQRAGAMPSSLRDLDQQSGTSPVLRMMRAQANKFPRPPQTVVSTRSASSSRAGDHQEPTHRGFGRTGSSVRSSSAHNHRSPPPSTTGYYAGSSSRSVLSSPDDDSVTVASSSVKTPTSESFSFGTNGISSQMNNGGRYQYPARSSSASRRPGNDVLRSGRNQGNFGGRSAVSRVDEVPSWVEQQKQQQQYDEDGDETTDMTDLDTKSMTSASSSRYGGGYGGRMGGQARTAPPPLPLPLKISSTVTGTGMFYQGGDESGNITDASATGRQGSAPGPNVPLGNRQPQKKPYQIGGANDGPQQGADDDMVRMDPVIRDFDEQLHIPDRREGL